MKGQVPSQNGKTIPSYSYINLQWQYIISFGVTMQLTWTNFLGLPHCAKLFSRYKHVCFQPSHNVFSFSWFLVSTQRNKLLVGITSAGQSRGMESITRTYKCYHVYIYIFMCMHKWMHTYKKYIHIKLCNCIYLPLHIYILYIVNMYAHLRHYQSLKERVPSCNQTWQWKTHHN